MFLFKNCIEAATVFASSLENEALLQGTSDVVVVKHKDGHYRSTPFLSCFGPYAVLSKTKTVKLYINGSIINDVKLSLDKHGYSYPMYPNNKDINKMNLKHGKNEIIYELEGHQLKAQIHLFTDEDKILISDVDGTLTKNDLGGIIGNAVDTNYLHEGYAELIRKIAKNGYKIVWITMRSLPLYEFSKKYIQNMVGVDGVLLTEPEQFLPAVKKEVLKRTGNVKANLMNQIKNLFPSTVNPFIGGLGNRQNDAIAYYHAGIKMESIFIIDTKSRVHKLDTNQFSITYKQMLANIHQYFPKYKPTKAGH